jgi:hypothetical protein
MPEQLTFTGDDRFQVADVQFVCSNIGTSTTSRFYIAKPRALVERYAELCRRFQSCRMVELGIAAGGSTALIAPLAKPRKLVALEVSPKPLAGLAGFIEERGLSDEVAPPKPLSRLLIELTLARASSGDAVDEITIGPFWAVIRRGPSDLDPTSFRVAGLYHDHFGLAPA